MLKKLIKKLIPKAVARLYHLCLTFLGALVFGFPSKKIKVIGVTGTNGKSTTVLMISRILEEAGYKVGSVSSMWFKIGAKEFPNPLHMTMPGRFILQKLMRQMVKAGCQYAVLEVTSEGILQSRHKFIKFDVAVLTNLSPEHIERHGSFEKYREAKGKFFESVQNTHIINLDDENADYFLNFSSQQKICYGFNALKIEKLKIDWELEIGNWKFIKADELEATKTEVAFKIGKTPFGVPLLGGFNAYNALVATAVGLSQGVSLEVCQQALAKIDLVAGRMEIIQREPFLAIVDLGHTPVAVENVYKTCKAMIEKDKKLIVVFGAAGGGRDKWKRPELGKLAGCYCDIIIVTNEDPYDENPEKIINDIVRGIADCDMWLNKNLFKIPNRQEAVNWAIYFAKQGDIVLFLGKGTEATMVFQGGKKIAWNERKIIESELLKASRNEN